MLNADDELCMSLKDRYGGEVRTFGFGPQADVRATEVRREDGVMTFRACAQAFRLPLLGRHNVLNALAAVCVSLWAGATPEQAQKALGAVSPPPMRFEKRQVGGVTFILDCHNSNPTAMRAALRAFLEEPVARRRVVVCGDMLELGQAGPQMHARIGRMLALTRVDALVAVGPLGRFLVEGWAEFASESRTAVHFDSPEDAWLPLWRLLAPGDAVLVKGSRAMRLEKILTAIAAHVGAEGREAAA